MAKSFRFRGRLVLASVTLVAIITGLLLPAFSPSAAAGSREFEVYLEPGDSYWENFTLQSPNDTNSYFVSTQPHRGIALYVNLENVSSGNLTILTVREHSTTSVDYIPELCCFGNKSRVVWSHYISREETGNLTIMISTDIEGEVNYTVYLTAWDFKPRSRESSSVKQWMMMGALGFTLVLLPYGAWVIWKSPKYRKSLRTVRFSPQDITRNYFSLALRQHRNSKGKLVGRTKYATRKGKELPRCPFCKKTIGDEENRFFYSSLSFVDVLPLPDDFGNPRYRTWWALSVYCQSCTAVLGITKK